MARILVVFYNAIKDSANLNAKPHFYESFVDELDKAGNDVFVISHHIFGQDFGEIDEGTKNAIREFNPDICFIFNNCFYDISEEVSCPIVIYEVDCPLYFSNKDSIKRNSDRYLFFIIQQDSRQILVEEFGIKDRQIFYVPFFTEIYADNSVEQTTNISFIGSLFMSNTDGVLKKFIQSNPTTEEWRMMKNILDHLRHYPQVTTRELIYKYNITSELVAKSMDLKELIVFLSSERRMKVLSAVCNLGLDLYGTKDWINNYYFNIDLNIAFINKKVYSVKHNQDIYNSSKIGISVAHYQATSGFPWRIMDIMASNACLVTDYHSDFEKLFGKAIIPIYESEADAREVCKQLLQDESRRREIVLQCQEIVNEKYRFKHLLPKLEEYSGVVMHA